MNEVLNKYFEEGLVYKQVHPTLPLTIWNYSEKVQYEGLFDDVTLQTRGLVTDDKGNVVARPFRKFFNIEEERHTPTSEFDVYEKMDGSLGILFNYEGQWVMATRGSFASDQSLKGFFMLQKYDFKKLHKDYTYLFEIIYDDNRIVVKYDYEDLVLLGMINTETGYEVDLHGEGNDVRLKNMVNTLGFKVVKNNLARRAIAQTPHEKLDEWLVGPTALAFSTDPVAAAKVAVKFSEGNDKLQVVGGILGEQKLDKAAVIALAKLPSLDELRAKFLAVLNAPASQIARILVEPGTRVARVIHAHGSAA
jgi:ribosomal protein L10